MSTPSSDETWPSGLMEDQRRRWLRGERVPAETYREQSATLRDNPEALCDLVQNEVLLREQVGEAPALDEYLARFPDLADGLRKRWAARDACREALTTLDLAAARPRAAHERPAPKPPDIPGFQILAYIDGGGQADVWRARHLGLDRVIALKVMRPEAGRDASRRARFRREGRAVARLDHPHIVHVFDCNEHDDRLYLVMEFLEGGTLRQRLDPTPGRPKRAEEKGVCLAPSAAAGLLATLAEAVASAHRVGIVHRDLKPENVLFRADGLPKVADFGLVKQLGADASGTTESGIILGSRYYMAPEQAAGRNRDMGPHTDVWALGVILYEVLTGLVPFHGETLIETLDHIRFTPLTPPSHHAPDLPAGLGAICARCLEKEPDRRYAHAGELAEDLARFLMGQPLLAGPAGNAGGAPGEAPPRIAGYEVLEPLADSSERVRLYRARRASTGEAVCVKVFLGLLGPDDMEHFRRQTLPALRVLDHPGLLAVHDAGHLTDGNTYLITEFLPGGNLRERIGNEPQPVADSVRLVAGVARILHEVHAHGLIHGNLEPSNILLDENGKVHIAEVGLVNQPAPAPELPPEFDTMVGMTMSSRDLLGWVGNIRYLAPEVIRREPLGRHTDVYGLGVVLYRMLAGRPPFDGDSLPRLMADVLIREPESLTRTRKDVPADLVNIMLHCLRKDPPARYPSTAAVADALERFLAGQSAPEIEPEGEGTVDEEAGTPARRGGEGPLEIPGYEILGPLARGAFATLYKARHLASGRLVALKVLHTEMPASTGGVDRLRHEAEILASLDHPGIIPVLDHGTHAGLVYLATRFVEGTNLYRLFRGEPPPLLPLLGLIEEVARIVGYLHGRGVLHRDLKPANIFLAQGPEGSPGRPVLVDFTLALRLGQSGEEKEGTIIGTPSYMAPEQAGGRTGELGPATDLWALGVILYEAATGVLPFRGRTTLDTLTLVMQGKFAPPRNVRHDLPPGIDAICARCLRPEPAERYPSAEALAEDLKRLREGALRGRGLWDRIAFWRR